MLPVIVKHSLVLYGIFLQLSLLNVTNVYIDAFTGFLQVEPATRQSFEALDVTYRRRSPNLSLRNSKCQSMLTSSPRNSQTNLAAPTPLSAAAYGFPPPPMVSSFIGDILAFTLPELFSSVHFIQAMLLVFLHIWSYFWPCTCFVTNYTQPLLTECNMQAIIHLCFCTVVINLLCTITTANCHANMQAKFACILHILVLYMVLRLHASHLQVTF